jgi:hypothetical protein
MGTCDYLRSITGQQLLFVGTESVDWTDAQFIKCGQFARSMGFDCVLLKVADGTEEWYGGASGFGHIRQLFLAQSVGCIPYVYSYGNHFGNFLDTEMNNALSYLKYGNIVCFDMEAEYDSHPEWANLIVPHFQKLSGATILISTWANPQHHGWDQIVRTLAPYVAAWMPQIYSNFLDTLVDHYVQLGVKCVQPTVMIDPTNWAGPNNPIAIAVRARSNQHSALSIWHYETCVGNVPLTRAILAAFPKLLSVPPDGGKQPVQPVQIKLNDTILKSLSDEWNAITPLYPGQKPPPFDQSMAIVKYWIAANLNGHKLGPPLGEEYDTNDWNKTLIKAQSFGSGKIEYNPKTGKCRVFTSFGELSTDGWVIQ